MSRGRDSRDTGHPLLQIISKLKLATVDFQGILDAYANSLTVVELYGPTNFAEVSSVVPAQCFDLLQAKGRGRRLVKVEL